ncbi:MAG TPA: PilX N-terminal domain-containing pilus assembly protein [Desulfomonilaceae bacterium]|nr:PilX N-terminal domain-containing pilus assembly protein [Desulfomonilaceae bacterium]
MRNESGSALVMVLGVLAIVSLIGVGLLQQSRSDTRFTRAMASSQHAFGLADGGIAVALQNLHSWSDRLLDQGWSGKIILKKLAQEPINTSTGTYEASGFFKAYDKTHSHGWDAGAFHNEFWLVEGRGDSAQVITIIDAAVVKINRSSYGDY